VNGRSFTPQRAEWTGVSVYLRGALCRAISTTPSSATTLPRPGRIDIVTVLIHELGHALGLPHSDDRLSVMYPAYQGPRRQLGQWDVTEIRRRYGEPTPPKPKEPPMDYRKLVCLLCRFVSAAFRCDSTAPGATSELGVPTPCQCQEIAKEAADLLAALVPELLAQQREQQ
jgi:hypothetical protein